MGGRLQLETHGGNAAVCLGRGTMMPMCLLVIIGITRPRSGKGRSHDNPDHPLGLQPTKWHRVTG